MPKLSKNNPLNLTKFSIVLLVFSLVMLCITTPVAAERTVMDSERSMIFGSAWSNEWSEIGANLDVWNSGDFERQPKESIKISHGRFDKFNPDDDTRWVYFPYSKFKTFEAEEVAAGRPPVWITATHQGRKRPVFWSWSMSASRESYRKQAVNVADDRFVKFYIHEYAYPILWRNHQDRENMWTGADECAFMYRLFGVVDDGGNYVRGVTWDEPFPQNTDEYLTMIKQFFKRLKELAPNINLMPNDGGIEVSSVGTVTAYSVYEDIPGVMNEDAGYYYEGTDQWYRDEFYKTHQKYKWLGEQGKVMLLQWDLENDSNLADNLRRSYVHYLIMRGDNSFYGPQFDVPEVPPSEYAEMRDALGLPTAPSQEQQESGQSEGYRLYWRETQGGIVYLNWTGGNKTISLPAGREYYDRNGNRVTSLTIPDRMGDYVTFEPGPRAPRLFISPRWGGAIAGPVSVTLKAPVDYNGTIRYTANGSEPTESSSLYTNPIVLNSSTTLKAKFFQSGKLPSHTNSKTYTITNANPTVEYHLANDNNTELVSLNHPLVKLSHVSAKTVTVNYVVSGGTATGGGTDYTLSNGTLTFQPGEKYRPFTIEITNDTLRENNETIEVTLSSPINATLGNQGKFTYTIVDNDGGGQPIPTSTPPSHCPPLGDIDCSGKVNSLDFAYLVAHWGASDPQANLDDTGVVDALDASILLSNFGKTSP